MTPPYAIEDTQPIDASAVLTALELVDQETELEKTRIMLCTVLENVQSFLNAADYTGRRVAALQVVLKRAFMFLEG